MRALRLKDRIVSKTLPLALHAIPALWSALVTLCKVRVGHTVRFLQVATSDEVKCSIEIAQLKSFSLGQARCDRGEMSAGVGQGRTMAKNPAQHRRRQGRQQGRSEDGTSDRPKIWKICDSGKWTGDSCQSGAGVDHRCSGTFPGWRFV